MVKKRIFLIGAGRSVRSFVQYITKHAALNHWHLVIGDISLENAQDKIIDKKTTSAIFFDVADQEQLTIQIHQADVVVSMLPASMHYPVAEKCVKLGKPLVTASYVASDVQTLDQQAKENKALLLMEMGLDPGIDHMSAKIEIDDILANGGRITSFKSFTGGLVAPESDTNPWNYKFTWNPRNVVLAGKGGVKFIRNAKYKYIPYHNLFKRYEPIHVDGYGAFEGYPNRDSLNYINVYGLEGIPTILRGTLRKKGFCDAWQVLVQLGYTNETIEIEQADQLTWRELTNSFLRYDADKRIEEKLREYLFVSDEIIEKLRWLGLFSDKKIPLSKATPAQLLQLILEEKWVLLPEDKDMIVMQHQFEYVLEGKNRQLTSSLVLKGDDANNTSMAKTVGLPLGIAVKLILTGQIELSGVQIPILPEIYIPVLKELEDYGIIFSKSDK